MILNPKILGIKKTFNIKRESMLNEEKLVSQKKKIYKTTRNKTRNLEKQLSRIISDFS